MHPLTAPLSAALLVACSPATSTPPSPPPALSSHPLSPAPSPRLFPVGLPIHAPLPIELLPLVNDVVAVSQAAGQPVAWVRRIDASNGTQGPLLQLVGEFVVGAFDRPSSGTAIVTSNGKQLCTTAFDAGASLPVHRGCANVSPILVAPLAGKLALVELTKHGHSSAVSIRWASLDGAFDPESHPTGLHINGATLIDAASRKDTLDLLFYEAQLHTKARLGRATLTASGAFDPSTRRTLAVGPHLGPRLLSGSAGSVVVVQRGRGRSCEAIQVTPRLGTAASSPALCALDPFALAMHPAASVSEDTAQRLLSLEPRRAPGQRAHDGPLIAWTQSRGFFVSHGVLRSVLRNGQDLRNETAPFPAQRPRLRGGDFAADGEGLAFLANQTVVVHEDGSTHAISSTLRTLPGTPRAARIGSSWWALLGDLVRVFPEPKVQLAGHGNPDTSALVEGPTHGFFLEVSGEVLRVTTVHASGLGTTTWVHSPVRAGFAAVRRGLGGALVAGVSTSDPTRTVAFALDNRGQLGAVETTPLEPNQGRVLLGAFPGGGAWLSSTDKLRVVWLDNQGHVEGHAVWTEERVPLPAIGQFVPLASRTVGEPVWTDDGALRWFASRSLGLDLTAEVGIARGLASVRSVATVAGFESTLVGPPACPSEMVSVGGHFCIDRYEAVLMDQATGVGLSPDLPSVFFEQAVGDWATARTRWGDVHARAMPLPLLTPDPRRMSPVALVRAGVRPSAFVQGHVAEAACGRAGKRLCSPKEFRTSCQGEQGTRFPYGDHFIAGACNVDREEHPAAFLHGNASIGHLDVRLGFVRGARGPLLRPTGATSTCRSVWGSDAVYDLVGNLDEWVAHPRGAFAGGFYSRTTHAGCDALIQAHPKGYVDYSLGVRCCLDPLQKVPESSPE